MGDYLLVVPLVAALAIGWYLGRREAGNVRIQRSADRFSEEYFSGLNHLIDNKTDEAIDSFIKALQCNSETVPIRLALGSLLRKRGEVQRSIQLHQEVLALPSLSSAQSLQIQLALARDYLAAGLLDRAEAILVDIVANGDRAGKATAAPLLIDIYQREKEWEKALSTATQLSAGSSSLNPQLAHFNCELAELAIGRQQWDQARASVSSALKLDPGSVRASLLGAKIEMAQKGWKSAIRYLKAVSAQDASFISEAIPMLATCYRELGANGELIKYLEVSLGEAPSTTALLILAEEISREKGDYQAGAFITEQLKFRPSIKGFNRLIDLHIKHASQSAKESLYVLRGLTGQLEQSKPVYRCYHCGFSGRTLHWQCPRCKEWGGVRPIQGLEGE